MNVNELAKALDNLSPGDALALLDSIARVQERAAKEREEKAAAEKERDERYPTCTCGKPATEVGFFLWYTDTCKPGVKRKGGDLRGGMVFTGNMDVSDPPAQVDTSRIDRTLWVSCGGEYCEYKAIENGFELKVGEE